MRKMNFEKIATGIFHSNNIVLENVNATLSKHNFVLVVLFVLVIASIALSVVTLVVVDAKTKKMNDNYKNLQKSVQKLQELPDRLDYNNHISNGE